MAVDPYHRYSLESEIANNDNHDYFKLKETIWSPWLFLVHFEPYQYPLIPQLRLEIKGHW